MGICLESDFFYDVGVGGVSSGAGNVEQDEDYEVDQGRFSFNDVAAVYAEEGYGHGGYQGQCAEPEEESGCKGKTAEEFGKDCQRN